MKRRRVLMGLAFLMVLVAGSGLSAQEGTDSGACPATIAVARFSDTGNLPAGSIAAISCIAHYGITAGTTPSTFSPADPVSRSQMARFLIRTAGALGVELPDGETSPFEDVDELDDDGRRSISRLWELGVTRGTGSGRFSPQDTVSRRQMALFLSRLLKTAEVRAGAGSRVPAYGDIDGLPSGVTDAIGHLAGIGVGWPGASEVFEPDRAVTREEMALLLAAALDAGGARHVRLALRLSASSAPTSSVVVATVTATKPNGDPYPGLFVDVFVSEGLQADGSCGVDRDARVNGTDGGTSVDCRIDRADPRTDSAGEVEVGLAHSPIAERNRVFAWTGHPGQEYDEESVRDQVWTGLEWLAVPSEVRIKESIDEEFGTFVQIEARLLGENVGGHRMIMLVMREGATVVTRVADTSSRGVVRFTYLGPRDPSTNNDPEVVEVIRVFWDRNRNGVHDGPAELFDETTATWDDL